MRNTVILNQQLVDLMISAPLRDQVSNLNYKTGCDWHNYSGTRNQVQGGRRRDQFLEGISTPALLFISHSFYISLLYAAKPFSINLEIYKDLKTTFLN
jgi:hypothetical protein